MTDIRYVSISEVFDILEQEDKDRMLTPTQLDTLDHARKFKTIPADQIPEMLGELLGFERVSEVNAYRIINILPEESDDLRAIFSKERFVLTTEEVGGIMEVVDRYR